MTNFGIKTSKITYAGSLSLILILTVSMIVVFTPLTLAQIGIPQPEKTSGYIDVAPRLVGVGQTATVNLFVYPIPTNYRYTGYFDGYRGVTVTFIKPDGSKDTFMPVDGTGQYDPGQMQSLGAIFFFYKPDMAGNWSVSFTMPPQNLTTTAATPGALPPYGTVLMKGCTSKPAYFTVQKDPVLAGLLNGYPWSPLPDPNVYWQYPISSNNREWHQISGDWLGQASTTFTINSATQLRWQPYGTGPNTGHIVWKQQYRDGGIIGGDYGSISYGAQSSVINTVIMEGKLFANIPNTNKFECFDLTTGKVLYTADGQISGGLHLPGNAYSQTTAERYNVLLESSFGSDQYPYLWGTSGTTWNYYDPLTGVLRRSLVNCSSARLIDGSMLAYGTASGNVFRWNYSKVPTSGTTANNWTAGIEWTKPLPTSLMGTQPSLWAISTDASTIVLRVTNGYWGYNAATGASLWNLTLNYPVQSNQAFPLARGVDNFIILDPTESTFKCYSLLTGAFLWESDTFSDATWATTWTVYWSETNDNENLYAIFSDGTMRAYSLTDGHEIWRSKPIASTEYPNNVVPYVCSVIMVDGKLYGFAGYSSQYKINPISRHAMMICIDAATGDTVFTLNGGIRVSAAANGYVIGTGDLDGNLYALGKGPTQTTVSAPLTSVSAGTSVLIQGSVMDMSPATQDYASHVRFANGVPAVSDADMSEWMDYLYMQNATLQNSPPAPKGVPVKLVAVSSNGNTIDIGTVTSNSGGSFSETWMPPSEDKYTVYATFDGSNSYYGSYAQTALSVTKASTETSNQQQITVPDYTMTLIVGFLAVIIAVALATVLILRKK